MNEVDPLADLPHIAGYLEELAAAFDAAIAQIDGIEKVGQEDWNVVISNALNGLFLALGDANDRIGISPGRNETQARLIDLHARKATTNFALGHKRAMATAAAYEARIRLESGGANDTPIEAAMLAAARLEGLFSLDEIETVRKSIQRYRKKIHPVARPLHSSQDNPCLGTE